MSNSLYKKEMHHTDSATLLMRDAKMYKLLSEGETIDLVARMRNGDSEAKKLLVASNVRLAFHAASRNRTKGIEYSEKVALACFAMCRVAENFDINKGKLSTFLYPSMQVNVSRGVKRQNYPLTYGYRTIEKIDKLRREKEVLERKLKRKCTDEELIEFSSLSTSNVEEFLNTSYEYVSLNAPLGGNYDNSLHVDLIAKDTDVKLSEEFEREDIYKLLIPFFPVLTSKEEIIIRLKYSIRTDMEPFELKEIADLYGVSHQTIAATHTRAIKKLAYAHKKSNIFPNYVCEELTDELIQRSIYDCKHPNKTRSGKVLTLKHIIDKRAKKTV